MCAYSCITTLHGRNTYVCYYMKHGGGGVMALWTFDAFRAFGCNERKKKKTHKDICMYIQNFIMEYSVESVFPVNANGLHNITQWKTKNNILPTEKEKKMERKSCFLLYSTALCRASHDTSTLRTPPARLAAASMSLHRSYSPSAAQTE